jgi:hypothetical protein
MPLLTDAPSKPLNMEIYRCSDCNNAYVRHVDA